MTLLCKMVVMQYDIQLGAQPVSTSWVDLPTFHLTPVTLAPSPLESTMYVCQINYVACKYWFSLLPRFHPLKLGFATLIMSDLRLVLECYYKWGWLGWPRLPGFFFSDAWTLNHKIMQMSVHMKTKLTPANRGLPASTIGDNLSSFFGASQAVSLINDHCQMP